MSKKNETTAAQLGYLIHRVFPGATLEGAAQAVPALLRAGRGALSTSTAWEIDSEEEGERQAEREAGALAKLQAAVPGSSIDGQGIIRGPRSTEGGRLGYLRIQFNGDGLLVHATPPGEAMCVAPTWAAAPIFMAVE